MASPADDPTPATSVIVAAPEQMNLLGLMLRGVLERGLARAPNRLCGEIAIEAGGMRVTLCFGPNRVEVTRQAPAGRPIATIRGTLSALCDAALGRGRLRAWLAGRLRVRGSPLALLRLLALLRVK